MANPLVLPSQAPELYEKKRKLEETTPPSSQPQTESKLKRFQRQDLEENVDYISLQSSLSLLTSRLDQIQREIKELHQFKRCIKQTSSVKEVTKLVHNNTDYLKEIHYKGCYIKCPVINWEREYGLDIDLLTDSLGGDVVSCHERINGQYEIIKRDKLFN